eukprot:UN23625
MVHIFINFLKFGRSLSSSGIFSSSSSINSSDSGTGILLLHTISSSTILIQPFISSSSS